MSRLGRAPIPSRRDLLPALDQHHHPALCWPPWATSRLVHRASHDPSAKRKPWPKHIGSASYRSISNPTALAEYAKLAGPAITAGGGRFLARGTPSKTYEAGLDQRTVLIEFDSVAQAMAAHDSPGYQAALAALGNGAERDIRIVEGVG